MFVRNMYYSLVLLGFLEINILMILRYYFIWMKEEIFLVYILVVFGLFY